MTTTSAIETNDIEPIPANERHGKPWHLFTVWSSPNLEFATIFIGALAVFAGLNVWHAILAVMTGNALAAITHGYLSSWGPKSGVPQMVLSRSAFGLRGNILPAATSTLVAGIGWFAVNTTSGAFALQSLTSLSIEVSLLIIIAVQVVVAFIGHNAIQKFERYAFYYLVVVFLIVSAIIVSQGNFTVAPENAGFNLAGFTLAAATAYGYTAGWTPFASDYARYLPANSSPRAVGLSAGLGNFFATSLLMSIGAIAWSGVVSGEGNPTDLFTAVLPGWLASLTLLGIAVGSVSANVLNVYSGAMSFIAAGVKLGFKTRRAIMVALAGGIGGTAAYLAVASDFVMAFEGFLLVVSYWVAPWIAIVVTDRILRKGADTSTLIAEKSRYENLAGPIAFVVSAVTSIALFANQSLANFYGVFAKATGDLTPFAGFILAATIYALLFKAMNKK